MLEILAQASLEFPVRSRNLFAVCSIANFFFLLFFCFFLTAVSKVQTTNLGCWVTASLCTVMCLDIKCPNIVSLTHGCTVEVLALPNDAASLVPYSIKVKCYLVKKRAAGSKADRWPGRQEAVLNDDKVENGRIFYLTQKKPTKYSNTTNGFQATEDRRESVTGGRKAKEKGGLEVRFL